jgi:hypothetical protein
MYLPTIQGVIRRRILVNYRVDPVVMRRLLPARFRPKLYKGHAVAGICLIRLEHIRPKMLPALIGLSSENAAHRVAVQWDDSQGIVQEGVFIPRRDTGSPLNCLLGGRVFPGEHHKATFTINESDNEVALSMNSRDGGAAVEVRGRVASSLPESSIFESTSAASSFFESGCLGYSPTRDLCRFDGITLDVKQWRVQPFEATSLFSSYFADESKFPRGSVEFDHALIMRDMDHEWHAAPDFRV